MSQSLHLREIQYKHQQIFSKKRDSAQRDSTHLQYIQCIARICIFKGYEINKINIVLKEAWTELERYHSFSTSIHITIFEKKACFNIIGRQPLLATNS